MHGSFYTLTIISIYHSIYFMKILFTTKRTFEFWVIYIIQFAYRCGSLAWSNSVYEMFFCILVSMNTRCKINITGGCGPTEGPHIHALPHFVDCSIISRIRQSRIGVLWPGPSCQGIFIVVPIFKTKGPVSGIWSKIWSWGTLIWCKKINFTRKIIKDILQKIKGERSKIWTHLTNLTWRI